MGDTDTLNRNRLGTLMVVLVVAAAFGPYIGGTSIRTEQAVIYGLLLLILPFTFLSMYIPLWGVRLGIFWVAYLCASAIAVGFIPTDQPTSPPGSLLAGIDNLLLPIALTLLVWTAAHRAAAPRLLLLAAKLTGPAMAANGVLAILMTRIDLAGLLRSFVAPGAGDHTVAAAAAQLGRVSGVFGQPAEAGLAYGLGGLAICFV